MIKALHLGGLSTYNIAAVYTSPSFLGKFHLMQGQYLYFFRENTFAAEKIDDIVCE